jgi:hypothetical protein
MKRDTKPKRRWKFRGICKDAALLGVHRTSLYKVLAGVRPGKSLSRRYAELKQSQQSNNQHHAANH